MTTTKDIRAGKIAALTGSVVLVASPARAAPSGPFADILQIIDNLTSYLPNFMTMLGVIFYILGIILVIIALRGLGRRSEMGPGMGTYTPHVVKLIIGIFFVAFPAFETVLSFAFLGAPVESDPNQIFAYAPSLTAPFTGEGGSAARQVVSALTAIIMFVGVIAIARGLFVLNLAAQGTAAGGGPGVGSGITFLIAGIMAANFPLFMRVVEALVAP